MKLYGIKTCDTCRKALKALENAGRNVEFIEVRVTKLSPDKIDMFLANFGEALINTRSTTWRGLGEADRSRPPVVLLTDHPTLMKRPVIDSNGALHLGWSAQVQAALL